MSYDPNNIFAYVPKMTYVILRVLRVQDSRVIEVLQGKTQLAYAAYSYYEQFSDDTTPIMVHKIAPSLAANQSGLHTFRVRPYQKDGYKVVAFWMQDKDIPALRSWWESTGSMKGSDTWD